jgi:hypothetical protein
VGVTDVARRIMSNDNKQTELPIDIAADKLIEWLQVRHIIDDQWQKSMRVIRDTLDRLLPSLPLTVRTSLSLAQHQPSSSSSASTSTSSSSSSSSQSSSVHYWTVLQIMASLETYRKEVTGMIGLHMPLIMVMGDNEGDHKVFVDVQVDVLRIGLVAIQMKTCASGMEL